MSENDMEEVADEAVKDLRAYINTESQFIEQEHELHSKLYAIDNVWGHLNEQIPPELDNLHELNHSIYEGILDMRNFIDENELADIRFKKEEEENLQKLALDVEHRDYQAVSSDLHQLPGDIKKHLRVEKEHLKQLHHKFTALMKEMKGSKLSAILDEDITEKKEKEHYEKIEEYYFSEIYKFLRAYERILRHLWKKEHKLAGRIPE